MRPTVLAAAVAVLSGLVLAPAPAVAEAPAPATYTNPVAGDVVDTFPDPVTIRARDGFWYAYGTQNPVFQSRGETGERMLPILRSADLVNWEYAGEVFTQETQPAWHDGSRLWAPDVRYVDGRYYLYYSVPGRNTVGLATAPTPTGPWTDEGPTLPEPSGCPTGGIDQALFTDTDGTHWLYWGSYDTICVARTNADATHIEGPVTQVARGRRMEGAFVVRHEEFYYLFYSDAGCCDGAYSGYQVKAGRSTSPTGPFTDDEGVDLMALTSKGAIVAGANGNRWIGPGHNGFLTDLAGQDWLVYHGIPARDPDLARVPGIDRQLTRRPMLLDRLDWIDGWPVLRAGAGPSEGPQRAPVTAPVAGSTFNENGLAGMHPVGRGWSVEHEPDARGYATHAGGHRTSYLLSTGRAPADVRAEADLRVTDGAAGLVVGHRDRNHQVVAWLDRDRHALVTELGRGHAEEVTPLPAGFRFDSWHNVAVEVRGTRLTVEVTEDRMGDPVALQERHVPRSAARRGAVGVAARGAGVDADNVSAVPLYRPVTERVPEPEVGELLFGDEFDGAEVPGTTPDSPWRWVRGPAAGLTMTGDELSWPTGNNELHLGNNTAPVLLRDAPAGDFTVETRIEFAPDQVAQQAGILLYENDDRYFKLVHSVLPLHRGGGALLHVSEFGKEGERPTTTPPTPVANAPMFGGPAADTMWLRLSFHADTEHGENEVRAATSRDGRHWVHNGVWTLPTRDDLDIGLVSMNRTGAVAEFDYVRVYRAGFSHTR
ncbi:family 43 glycosylhydrolase [Actinophytocola gossypii]|uniref:Family 43 glycosylhydrolase n=1 Tax=Actinophytocola gossypii TaxID=2812003 RepID=A0ABT2J126_9PSEU|nr:family 43 glycosylhydrolase [Actinophytocola gossypii]MCT2581565.1 family 43 glycosylhydrolase [Actinophytocola gossypii]